MVNLQPLCIVTQKQTPKSLFAALEIQRLQHPTPPKRHHYSMAVTWWTQQFHHSSGMVDLENRMAWILNNIYVGQPEDKI